MSADWNICTLNEIVDFGNGKARPKTEGNIPIYGGNGVLGYSDESNYQDETIIIGRVGAYCGATYYENNPIWISDNALSAKAKEGYLSKYAYYVLKSKNLNQYAQGSSHPLLTQGLLKTIEAHVTTNLDVQKKIVSIISGLEDKIELNRQTNQTLEHIAQAIFKCWFVDFEPTRAKIIAKEKGANTAIQELAAQAIICGVITLEQLEAITQNLETTLQQAINEKLSQANQTPINTEQLKTTAALFPNELVDSELGEIPEGWEVQTIDNVTSNIIDHRGKTPKKLGGDWVDKGYPAISAKNVKGGRLVRHETIRFLSDELYSKWMKVEIEKGDILLTSEAPMGEMYFITDEIKYCLSQRLYGLRADNKNVTPAFLYLWLQTSIAQADLEGRATGTTVVGIRQVELKKVSVLIPSFEIVKIIESIVFSLYEKINANDSESKELSDLRETLLPKLLSGDLTI